MIKQEILVSPEELIKNVRGRAKELLQVSHIVVTTLGCAMYGTGEPWDTGECLGYCVYCPDALINEFEKYADYISAIGIRLTKLAYKKDKRQPGSCLCCRASILLEKSPMDNNKFGETRRKNFLENCIKK